MREVKIVVVSRLLTVCLIDTVLMLTRDFGEKGQFWDGPCIQSSNCPTGSYRAPEHVAKDCRESQTVLTSASLSQRGVGS